MDLFEIWNVFKCGERVQCKSAIRVGVCENAQGNVPLEGRLRGREKKEGRMIIAEHEDKGGEALFVCLLLACALH